MGDHVASRRKDQHGTHGSAQPFQRRCRFRRLAVLVLHCVRHRTTRAAAAPRAPGKARTIVVLMISWSGAPPVWSKSHSTPRLTRSTTAYPAQVKRRNRPANERPAEREPPLKSTE